MKKLVSLIAAAILALAANSCQEDPVFYMLQYEAISSPAMNMKISLSKPNMQNLLNTGGSHLLQDCGPVKPGFFCTITAQAQNSLPEIYDNVDITLRIILDDIIVKETHAANAVSLSYTVGE